MTDNEELPIRLLLWAGADPHRKVPPPRCQGQPDAWDEDMVYSSASEAILSGRHELFAALHVATMPDLEGQHSLAHDSTTLKKLVAIRPPQAWSEVIVAFVRHLWRPYGLTGSPFDVQDALSFIASSGGRLTVALTEDIRDLRRVLLDLTDRQAFSWVLRWLDNPQHCDPGIYTEVTRTAALRRKTDAFNAGTKYLTPSQKMKQATARRRKKAEGRRRVTPGDLS